MLKKTLYLVFFFLLNCTTSTKPRVDKKTSITVDIACESITEWSDSLKEFGFENVSDFLHLRILITLSHTYSDIYDLPEGAVAKGSLSKFSSKRKISIPKAILGRAYSSAKGIYYEFDFPRQSSNFKLSISNHGYSSYKLNDVEYPILCEELQTP